MPRMPMARVIRPPTANPARSYYLDESGNTGDLAKADATLAFDNQKHFVLACVGVDDEPALADHLAGLVARHRVQAAELKFEAVRNKPAFVESLAAYFAEHRLPVLIEAVDKRFSICSYIVSVLILPPVGPSDWDQQTRRVMNIFAERLAEASPTSLLHAYVSLCRAPSPAAVRAMFETLTSALKIFPADDITTALSDAVATSFADFKADRNKPANLARYLPPPDRTKTGKPLWMLPHLPCLTNIYGRLNRFHRGRLASVSLVHDEQMQFDEALQEGKRLAETIFPGGGPGFAHADFQFSETATLTFRPSHTSPGVQCADILAGFIADYFKSVLINGAAPSAVAHQALWTLLRLSDPAAGLGINMVLPSASIAKMGIPVA